MPSAPRVAIAPDGYTIVAIAGDRGAPPVEVHVAGGRVVGLHRR